MRKQIIFSTTLKILMSSISLFILGICFIPNIAYAERFYDLSAESPFTITSGGTYYMNTTDGTNSINLNNYKIIEIKTTSPVIIEQNTSSGYLPRVTIFGNKDGGTDLTIKDLNFQGKDYPGIVFSGRGNELKLEGDNYVRAGENNCAGVQVVEDDELIISDGPEEGTGILRAYGASYSAGIGSPGTIRNPNDYEDILAEDVFVGDITINSGAIYAYSNFDGGAGIGNGDYDNYDEGGSGVITITGGYVYAKGKGRGCGIGSARYELMNNIIISGGIVEAVGGDYSGQIPGIGYAKDVTISGGALVRAYPRIVANNLTISGGDTRVYLNSSHEDATLNDDIRQINDVSERQRIIDFYNDDDSVNANSFYYLYTRAYRVSYNPNGGIGSQTDDMNVYPKDEQVTILDEGSMTYAGKAFAGWNTMANGSGTPYAVGDTIASITADIELFAQWADPYTVTLNDNSGSGGSGSKTVFNGSAMPAVTPPTRTGYTFEGYWDATSGGTQYYTSAGASARNYDKTSNATLYARWTAKTYTISFNKQSGSGGSNSVTATYDSSMPSASAPSRTGYQFGGYYSGTGGSGNQYYYANMSSARAWDLTSNSTIYAKWTPNTYSVVFYGNGNDGGGMSNQSFTYATAKNLTTNGFTKTGYDFSGWSNSPTGSVVYSNAQSVNNLTSTNGGTVQLYAIWDIQKNSVSASVSGSGSVSPTTQQVNYGSNASAITATAGTGYHFTGWSGDASGMTNPVTIYGVTSDKNVTANFTPNNYTVVFNANYLGNTNTSTQGFTYDTAQNLTANSFSRTGYDFSGWATSPTGSVVYSNAQSVNNLTSTNGGLFQLYAVWVIKKYDVNASISGSGSVDPMTQKVNHGSNSLSITASSDTGYHFTGWSGDASGTDNPIMINNVISDKNITANFTANDYTVVFNGNGSDGGSTANQAFTYNTAQDLTKNGFARTGYTYYGWATSASGALLYEDEESVNNLTTINNGTVNLYAKWAFNRTLTYDGNGNTGNTMPTEQRGEGLTITLTPNTATKTGYEFAGWNTKEDGSGTPYADGASFTMPTEDTTLFAQWTPNSYTVVFNKNKGTGSTDISGTTSDQSFVYDIPQDLRTNAFGRVGYDFSGWSTTADGAAEYEDEENVSNLSAEQNGVFNLYAVWTAKDYVVTFKGNTNSSGVMVNQTFAFDQSVSLTKNTYVKIGHTFAGWNTLIGGGGTAYADESSFTMDVEGDTLYAQWTAINYSVTYDANLGSETPSDTNDYNYQDEVTVLAKGNMAREGYTFVCWNTSADGTGTDYNPADTFNMPANDVTLYAKWSADDQNITYDNNGGNGAGSDIQKTDTIFKLHDGKGFTKDDFIIDGWTIEGTDYLLGALYQMTTHDVTAEAIWKDDSDNDGVSDEDEVASGTDPNDPDDKMNKGKISITVLKSDGTPAAECTLRLNSEPIETTTDEEGKAMFGSVTLSPHILTLIDGTEVLGTYALDFTRNSSNETGIIDDASTDSDGSILTAVASNFLTLDMIIQQNGTNNWQLMLVEYMERLSNPKTGENVWD